MLDETVRYFGLTEDCFQLNFDLKYFFESIQHKEAYVRMKYSIDSRYPFYLLSGYPGSGKTIVTQLMNLQLNNSVTEKIKYKTIFIENSTEDFISLFKLILSKLTGKKYTNCDEYELFTEYKETILSYCSDNTYIVVFLDEAHNYNIKQLEYIRQLTNITEVKNNYMTICLIGQPELHDNIIKLPQLNHRIQIRYLLSPLDMKTTTDYIYFRLSRAGSYLKLFTNDALETIHMMTNGIPREINKLCNLCFDLAMLKLERKINKQIVKTALDELFAIKTDKEESFDVSIFKSINPPPE